MKLKSILLVVALLATLAVILAPLPAKAVECGFLPQEICDSVVNNPDKTGAGAVTPLVDYIVNIVTGIFVAAVILVIVISGVQMSASAGNPEVIKSAKGNILKAVTGIVLLISFRAIFSIFGIYDTGFTPPVTLFSNINTPETLADIGSINVLIANAIAIATFFAGLVSVIFTIVGGVRYITSAGQPEAIKSAKNTITYALVGLVVAIMAYGIVSFVIDKLT